jgi:hypothetical protein
MTGVETMVFNVQAPAAYRIPIVRILLALQITSTAGLILLFLFGLVQTSDVIGIGFVVLAFPMIIMGVILLNSGGHIYLSAEKLEIRAALARTTFAIDDIEDVLVTDTNNPRGGIVEVKALRPLRSNFFWPSNSSTRGLGVPFLFPVRERFRVQEASTLLAAYKQLRNRASSDQSSKPAG